MRVASNTLLAVKEGKCRRMRQFHVHSSQFSHRVLLLVITLTTNRLPSQVLPFLFHCFVFVVGIRPPAQRFVKSPETLVDCLQQLIQRLANFFFFVIVVNISPVYIHLCWFLSSFSHYDQSQS